MSSAPSTPTGLHGPHRDRSQSGGYGGTTTGNNTPQNSEGGPSATTPAGGSFMAPPAGGMFSSESTETANTVYSPLSPLSTTTTHNQQGPHRDFGASSRTSLTATDYTSSPQTRAPTNPFGASTSQADMPTPLKAYNPTNSSPMNPYGYQQQQPPNSNSIWRRPPLHSPTTSTTAPEAVLAASAVPPTTTAIPTTTTTTSNGTNKPSASLPGAFVSLLDPLTTPAEEGGGQDVLHSGGGGMYMPIETNNNTTSLFMQQSDTATTGQSRPRSVSMSIYALSPLTPQSTGMSGNRADASGSMSGGGDGGFRTPSLRQVDLASSSTNTTTTPYSTHNNNNSGGVNAANIWLDSSCAMSSKAVHSQMEGGVRIIAKAAGTSAVGSLTEETENVEVLGETAKGGDGDVDSSRYESVSPIPIATPEGVHSSMAMDNEQIVSAAAAPQSPSALSTGSQQESFSNRPTTRNSRPPPLQLGGSANSNTPHSNKNQQYQQPAGSSGTLPHPPITSSLSLSSRANTTASASTAASSGSIPPSIIAPRTQPPTTPATTENNNRTTATTQPPHQPPYHRDFGELSLTAGPPLVERLPTSTNSRAASKAALKQRGSDVGSMQIGNNGNLGSTSTLGASRRGSGQSQQTHRGHSRTSSASFKITSPTSESVLRAGNGNGGKSYTRSVGSRRSPITTRGRPHHEWDQNTQYPPYFNGGGLRQFTQLDDAPPDISFLLSGDTGVLPPVRAQKEIETDCSDEVDDDEHFYSSRSDGGGGSGKIGADEGRRGGSDGGTASPLNSTKRLRKKPNTLRTSGRRRPNLSPQTPASAGSSQMEFSLANASPNKSLISRPNLGNNSSRTGGRRAGFDDERKVDGTPLSSFGSDDGSTDEMDSSDLEEEERQATKRRIEQRRKIVKKISKRRGCSLWLMLLCVGSFGVMAMAVNYGLLEFALDELLEKNAVASVKTVASITMHEMMGTTAQMMRTARSLDSSFLIGTNIFDSSTMRKNMKIGPASNFSMMRIPDRYHVNRFSVDLSLTSADMYSDLDNFKLMPRYPSDVNFYSNDTYGDMPNFISSMSWARQFYVGQRVSICAVAGGYGIGFMKFDQNMTLIDFENCVSTEIDGIAKSENGAATTTTSVPRNTSSPSLSFLEKYADVAYNISDVVTELLYGSDRQHWPPAGETYANRKPPNPIFGGYEPIDYYSVFGQKSHNFTQNTTQTSALTSDFWGSRYVQNDEYVFIMLLATDNTVYGGLVAKDIYASEIFSNTVPTFSTATTQHTEVAIIADMLRKPAHDGSMTDGTGEFSPQVIAHTLQVGLPTKQVSTSAKSQEMLEIFMNVCEGGDKFTWHVVTNYVGDHQMIDAKIIANSTNVGDYGGFSIQAFFELIGTWTSVMSLSLWESSSLEKITRPKTIRGDSAVLCAVFCIADQHDAHQERCHRGQDSNLYFVARSGYMSESSFFLRSVMLASVFGSLVVFVIIMLLLLAAMQFPIWLLQRRMLEVVSPDGDIKHLLGEEKSDTSSPTTTPSAMSDPPTSGENEDLQKSQSLVNPHRFSKWHYLGYKFKVNMKTAAMNCKCACRSCAIRVTKFMWIADVDNLIRYFNLIAYMYLQGRRFVPQHVQDKLEEDLQGRALDDIMFPLGEDDDEEINDGPRGGKRRRNVGDSIRSANFGASTSGANSSLATFDERLENGETWGDDASTSSSKGPTNSRQVAANNTTHTSTTGAAGSGSASAPQPHNNTGTASGITSGSQSMIVLRRASFMGGDAESMTVGPAAGTAGSGGGGTGSGDGGAIMLSREDSNSCHSYNTADIFNSSLVIDTGVGNGSNNNNVGNINPRRSPSRNNTIESHGWRGDVEMEEIVGRGVMGSSVLHHHNNNNNYHGEAISLFPILDHRNQSLVEMHPPLSSAVAAGRKSTTTNQYEDAHNMTLPPTGPAITSPNPRSNSTFVLNAPLNPEAPSMRTMPSVHNTSTSVLSGVEVTSPRPSKTNRKGGSTSKLPHAASSKFGGSNFELNSGSNMGTVGSSSMRAVGGNKLHSDNHHHVQEWQPVAVGRKQVGTSPQMPRGPAPFGVKIDDVNEQVDSPTTLNQDIYSSFDPLSKSGHGIGPPPLSSQHHRQKSTTSEFGGTPPTHQQHSNNASHVAAPQMSGSVMGRGYGMAEESSAFLFEGHPLHDDESGEGVHSSGSRSGSTRRVRKTQLQLNSKASSSQQNAPDQMVESMIGPLPTPFSLSHQSPTDTSLQLPPTRQQQNQNHPSSGGIPQVEKEEEVEAPPFRKLESRTLDEYITAHDTEARIDHAARLRAGGRAADVKTDLTVAALRAKRKSGATMKIVDNCTVLVVRLGNMEEAYGSDFRRAEVDHNAMFLKITRICAKHRGAAFWRLGDLIGYCWNAFETTPSHALKAVKCAVAIAEWFADARRAGLRMGIAVHQGPAVCGTLGDETLAAPALVGEMTVLTFQLAELCMTNLRSPIAITERVKTSISIFYECLIVDAVKVDEKSYPLTVFEVRGIIPRPSKGSKSSSHVNNNSNAANNGLSVRQQQLRRKAMSVELWTTTEITDELKEITKYHTYLYNSAFARFRSHQFDEAVQCLEDLEQEVHRHNSLMRILTTKLAPDYFTDSGALIRNEEDDELLRGIFTTFVYPSSVSFSEPFGISQRLLAIARHFSDCQRDHNTAFRITEEAQSILRQMTAKVVGFAKKESIELPFGVAEFESDRPSSAHSENDEFSQRRAIGKDFPQGPHLSDSETLADISDLKSAALYQAPQVKQAIQALVQSIADVKVLQQAAIDHHGESRSPSPNRRSLLGSGAAAASSSSPPSKVGGRNSGSGHVSSPPRVGASSTIKMPPLAPPSPAAGGGAASSMGTTPPTNLFTSTTQQSQMSSSLRGGTNYLSSQIGSTPPHTQLNYMKLQQTIANATTTNAHVVLPDEAKRIIDFMTNPRDWEVLSLRLQLRNLLSGANIALLQKQMTHNPFKDLQKPYARRFPHWTQFEESAIKARKHDLLKSKAAAATNNHAQQLPQRRNHPQQRTNSRSNTSSPNLGQAGGGGSDTANIHNGRHHQMGSGGIIGDSRSKSNPVGGGLHRQNSSESAPYNGSQPSSRSSAGHPTNLPHEGATNATSQAFSPSALQLPHHIPSPSPAQNNNSQQYQQPPRGGRSYRDALTSESSRTPDSNFRKCHTDTTNHQPHYSDEYEDHNTINNTSPPNNYHPKNPRLVPSHIPVYAPNGGGGGVRAEGAHQQHNRPTCGYSIMDDDDDDDTTANNNKNNGGGVSVQLPRPLSGRQLRSGDLTSQGNLQYSSVGGSGMMNGEGSFDSTSIRRRPISPSRAPPTAASPRNVYIDHSHEGDGGNKNNSSNPLGCSSEDHSHDDPRPVSLAKMTTTTPPGHHHHNSESGGMRRVPSISSEWKDDDEDRGFASELRRAAKARQLEADEKNRLAVERQIKKASQYTPRTTPGRKSPQSHLMPSPSHNHHPQSKSPRIHYNNSKQVSPRSYSRAATDEAIMEGDNTANFALPESAASAVLLGSSSSSSRHLRANNNNNSNKPHSRVNSGDAAMAGGGDGGGDDIFPTIESCSNSLDASSSGGEEGGAAAYVRFGGVVIAPDASGRDNIAVDSIDSCSNSLEGGSEDDNSPINLRREIRCAHDDDDHDGNDGGFDTIQSCTNSLDGNNSDDECCGHDNDDSNDDIDEANKSTGRREEEDDTVVENAVATSQQSGTTTPRGSGKDGKGDDAEVVEMGEEKPAKGDDSALASQVGSGGGSTSDSSGGEISLPPHLLLVKNFSSGNLTSSTSPRGATNNGLVATPRSSTPANSNTPSQASTAGGGNIKFASTYSGGDIDAAAVGRPPMNPTTTSSSSAAGHRSASHHKSSNQDPHHHNHHRRNSNHNAPHNNPFEKLSASASAFTSLADFQKNLRDLNSKNLPPLIETKNGTIYSRSDTMLGAGSYGKVYLGMEEHTGQLVAMKVMPLPDDPSEVEKIENEVSIMRTVHDENLVDLYDYCIVKSRYIVLVMECIVAGSLSSMLTSFKHFAPQTVANFLKDVVRGLATLHAADIIHRDVKPQNVLVTSSGKCKISDFGASARISALARSAGEGGGMVIQGTPLYLAPEAARGRPTLKSDIWSVGIMFLHLVTGKPPYSAEDEMLKNPMVFTLCIAKQTIKPIIPSSLPPDARDFVLACLKPEEQRPSADDLLHTPFLL